MNSLSHLFRYVPDGGPTLLATFDEALAAQAAHVAEKPATLWRWYITRCSLAAVRAMLRHERPFWAHVYLAVRELTNLSDDEATARYWANAPAEKIGEHTRVHRTIAALHEAARRRPCHPVPVALVAPISFVTNRIYWK